MKRVLAALLGIALSAGAAAAPRAESALECGIAADMAVVARSLAEERVQPPQAGAIMARIYDLSDSPRGRELMKEIIEAAYSNGKDTRKFAEDLYAACMSSGGNMDVVLGRRL